MRRLNLVADFLKTFCSRRSFAGCSEHEISEMRGGAFPQQPFGPFNMPVRESPYMRGMEERISLLIQGLRSKQMFCSE